MRKVFLFEQNEYLAEEISEKTMSVLIANRIDVEKRSVYIAPCWESLENRPPATAHPEVALGAALAFHRMGAEDVVIGENLVEGVSAVAPLLNAPQRKLLTSCARLVPLEKKHYVTVKIRKPLVQTEFHVPRRLFMSDINVAVSKMKTNLFCDVSSSVWNLFLQLPPRERAALMDDLFNMRLVDVARVRLPDLVVADGVVAGEGQGPRYPTAVGMKLLVMGPPPETDAVCSHLMGIDPFSVDHLRLITETGAGTLNVHSIAIENRELLRRRMEFRRAEWGIENAVAGVRVHGGTKKFCPAGCVGLVRQALDSLTATQPGGCARGVDVVVGEPVEPGDFVLSRNALIAGDCAAPYRGKGRFVGGRPPVPEELEIAVLKACRTNFPAGFGLKYFLAGAFRAPVAFRAQIARGTAVVNVDGKKAGGFFLWRLMMKSLAYRAKKRLREIFAFSR
ncbi:MAG: DUF362 domain-containing protein [bacterium]